MLGNDGVWWVDSSEAQFGIGPYFTVTGLLVSYLTEGDRLNLATKEVRIAFNLIHSLNGQVNYYNLGNFYETTHHNERGCCIRQQGRVYWTRGDPFHYDSGHLQLDEVHGTFQRTQPHRQRRFSSWSGRVGVHNGREIYSGQAPYGYLLNLDYIMPGNSWHTK